VNSAPHRHGGAVPEGRAALRERLILARLGLPAPRHAAASAAIAAVLAPLLARIGPRVVGFCWPYRGEFDCRAVVSTWCAAAPGRGAALPVIVERASPMVFRTWTPQSRLVPGRYGIPVPEDDVRVAPDLLLMPLVGFDHRGYRLGYGGGYFDRTLAALDPRPRAVGVGFELARLPWIEADSHDIPMDFVVTEAGLFEISATK
jgi:5,10-methenyltetrahydrofolate synthetase